MGGDPITYTTLLQAVNTFGVVAVLIFFMLAFYQGKIISKTILDRILEVYERQFEEMTDRIMKRLDDALEGKK